MKLGATIIAFAFSLFFTTSVISQDLSPRILIPNDQSDKENVQKLEQDAVDDLLLPEKQKSEGFVIKINHNVMCFEINRFLEFLKDEGYVLQKGYYQMIEGEVSKVGGTEIWLHKKDRDYYVTQRVVVGKYTVSCVLSHMGDFVEE